MKLVFTGFLFDVQHLRNSVENKPASSLAVSLSNALNRTPLLSDYTSSNRWQLDPKTELVTSLSSGGKNLANK